VEARLVDVQLDFGIVYVDIVDVDVIGVMVISVVAARPAVVLVIGAVAVIVCRWLRGLVVDPGGWILVEGVGRWEGCWAGIVVRWRGRIVGLHAEARVGLRWRVVCLKAPARLGRRWRVVWLNAPAILGVW
jgi:hypothetical protein